MKKYILFISILLLKISLYAQTADSVTMLPGTAVDVYYNLSTGHKDTIRNTNWHLAFAVRKAQPPMKTMQAATILINDGRNVELFKSNSLISDWSSFDTSGWMTWPQTFNSDSTWDIGAFNQNRNLSNAFDYGWGQYNMSTKDVSGNQIWLVSIPSSSAPNAPRLFKKLAIHKIVFDTMWVFTYSNLDGSDSTTLTINKSNFGNKLFAYVNLLTKNIIDREPPLNTWDIVFTRYKTLVTLFGQTLMYPVMGVLQNPAVSATTVERPDARVIVPDTGLKFDMNIARIGWNWKLITVTPGPWPVRDSLSYIVKVASNKIYRLFFTDYYADQSKQYVKFNTTYFEKLTAQEEIKKSIQNLAVYPNPVSDKVNVGMTFSGTVDQINIQVLDMCGRQVYSEKMENVNGGFSKELELNSFERGVYFIRVEMGGISTARKIILN